MTKDLLIKYLNGNCTHKEFEEILNWLKEESMTDAGKSMVQEVWEEFEPEAGKADHSGYISLLDKIHHQINLNQNSDRPVIVNLPVRKRIMTLITRAAAILLLPVLSLLIYTQISGRLQYASNSKDLEIKAPAGFRTNIELGDGTIVWLNNGSTLRYPYRFTGKSRKVYLTGEAYFKVAHNNKVPFIVETKELDVIATGTAFNVSAYPGDDFVETTLVEGKVILYDNSRQQEVKELSPNECLKFKPSKNSYTMKSGDIEKYIAWKDGMLVFKNDSVSEIARRLEQWYNIDVRIMNKRVDEFTYTATFYDESLTQVLELMSLPTPVSYKLTPIKKLPDGSFTRQSLIIDFKK